LIDLDLRAANLDLERIRARYLDALHPASFERPHLEAVFDARAVLVLDHVKPLRARCPFHVLGTICAAEEARLYARGEEEAKHGVANVGHDIALCLSRVRREDEEVVALRVLLILEANTRLIRARINARHLANSEEILDEFLERFRIREYPQGHR